MNESYNEFSFCELRSKEVVNAVDGKRMGRITDIVFSSETGKIKGIVTPYGKHGIFCKNQDIFIPWRCVRKVGEDVIIVDLNESGTCDSEPICPPPKCDKENKHANPPCDRRCEKCMLFDCEYRWKNN
jgi:YlmC/YmxH family sporulation protein